jgi:hypothetical protein
MIMIYGRPGHTPADGALSLSGRSNQQQERWMLRGRPSRRADTYRPEFKAIASRR